MHGFPLSRTLFWVVLVFLGALTVRPWVGQWLGSQQSEPRAITARGDLAGDEQSTIAIFESISPSVVFITTTAQLASPWTRNITEVQRGTGSGFFWDDQGHVVTNYHVIAEARSAQVRLTDGRSFNATLVGASPEHDLAVLRIDVGFKPPRGIPIGTSADLKVGQKVLAIGNPFGFDYSLTTGVVSALDRTIQSEEHGEIRRLIQTDAAINPGNSGGPLIDSAGRLIGINTAIFSPSGAYSGIGFAVPVDTVNRIVPELISHGRYVRPRIGIQGDDAISKPIMAQLGATGVLILRIESQSPADRAGLRATRVLSNGEVVPGDIIQAVDGHPVKDMADLIDLLEGYAIDQTIQLTVLRNGHQEVVPLTLGGRFQQLD